MSYVLEVIDAKGRLKEMQRTSRSGLAGEAGLRICAETEVSSDTVVYAVVTTEPANKTVLDAGVDAFTLLLTQTTQGAHGLARGPYAQEVKRIEKYFPEPDDAAKFVDNYKRDPARPKQGFMPTVTQRMKEYGNNAAEFVPERRWEGKKK